MRKPPIAVFGSFFEVLVPTFYSRSGVIHDFSNDFATVCNKIGPNFDDNCPRQEPTRSIRGRSPRAHPKQASWTRGRLDRFSAGPHSGCFLSSSPPTQGLARDSAPRSHAQRVGETEKWKTEERNILPYAHMCLGIYVEPQFPVLI